MTKIAFIGLGNLGSQVLDLFLHTVMEPCDVLVAGRNLERLQQRSNLSLFAAEQLGFRPHLTCVSLDLSNLDQTAETLFRFQPEMIFSAVSTQPWMAITKLPPTFYERLYQAHAGPWLPMTLAPTYKLMRAIEKAGLTSKVINGSYPDSVNAVLSKVSMAPLTGIGNLANTIPAMKHAIAFLLHVPLHEIEIRFVAHHYVSHHISRYGHTGGAPYHLSVLVKGQPYAIDAGAIFQLLPTTFKRIGGSLQLLTAASAVTLIKGLQSDMPLLAHAPGPHGLPGGYPIQAQKQALDLLLPEGLQREEAIRINEEGQRFDGIQQIDPDGTVHFTMSNMAILKEILGYECRKMPLSEVELWSTELKARYDELVSRVWR